MEQHERGTRVRTQAAGPRGESEDPFDLTRFLTAQEGSYTAALSELVAGRKTGHWMWFVFPQVVGLGYSPMAELYAIRSLAEARAYLTHGVLGARLREVSRALLSHRGLSALQVLGSPDDLKLRSSMTLFATLDVADGEFAQVLERYYGGSPDPLTEGIMRSWPAEVELAANGTYSVQHPDDTHAVDDMWESADVAKRFAERPPDHRLVALMKGDGAYAHVRQAWAPGPRPKVLDVGCAGGRNTVWLAANGADVLAFDASSAMVAETKARLAEVVGLTEAERRVRKGYLHDLSAYPTGEFDLVVALGALQNAQSDSEWQQALAETARVLRPGGLALVANFAPDSAPAGTPLTRVPGSQDVWAGFESPNRRMTLPSVDRLDAHFGQHGLLPVLPTERVRVDTPRGHRVTLNALYLRTVAPR